MYAEIMPVDWVDGKVVLLDQTRLPLDLVYLEFSDYRDVAEAIRTMVVRGAPAIGVTAALGMALGAQSLHARDSHEFLLRFDQIADVFRKTRPTAVNLFWAVDRMLETAKAHFAEPLETIRLRLLDEARSILEEDIRANRLIGDNGSTLLRDGDTILTHCNAGALATAGYGTALGVIRSAIETGKRVKVIADETRPRLQGMKLTCWELLHSGIPVTCITDNMAGWVMSRGIIDCVLVGADRIAANGDVANKVGTYGLAVLAHAHRIPFYVAAPVSTVDLSIPSGDRIPIEERPPEEVTHISGKRIAPEGVAVMNPAFDVTPAKYVTAIVTDKGILRAPYASSLRKASQ